MNTAKHYLTCNGKFFAPGDRVDGLTDDQWKQLMADKAIECDVDAEELALAELEGLENEQEISGETALKTALAAIKNHVAVPDADDEDDEHAGDESETLKESEAPEESVEEAELADDEMPDMSGADSIVDAGAPEAPKQKPKQKRAKGGKPIANQAGQ